MICKKLKFFFDSESLCNGPDDHVRACSSEMIARLSSQGYTIVSSDQNKFPQADLFVFESYHELLQLINWLPYRNILRARRVRELVNREGHSKDLLYNPVLHVSLLALHWDLLTSSSEHDKHIFVWSNYYAGRLPLDITISRNKLIDLANAAEVPVRKKEDLFPFSSPEKSQSFWENYVTIWMTQLNLTGAKSWSERWRLMVYNPDDHIHTKTCTCTCALVSRGSDKSYSGGGGLLADNIETMVLKIASVDWLARFVKEMRKCKDMEVIVATNFIDYKYKQWVLHSECIHNSDVAMNVKCACPITLFGQTLMLQSRRSGTITEKNLELMEELKRVLSVKE